MTTAVKKAKQGTVLVNSRFYAVMRETKKGHIRVVVWLRHEIDGAVHRLPQFKRTFYAYGHKNYVTNPTTRQNAARAWAEDRLAALAGGLHTEFLYSREQTS
jgi:hypothetical protein